jgi:hypothetical protein
MTYGDDGVVEAGGTVAVWVAYLATVAGVAGSCQYRSIDMVWSRQHTGGTVSTPVH